MGEQLELQIGLAQWEGRWGGLGFSGGGGVGGDGERVEVVRGSLIAGGYLTRV